jgi:serine/threonine protein kinase
MTLVPGTRLGPYQILALLGAGGMGEVYRARDSKLGREVALKVLPPKFSADAERMARFGREAQVLASLNHPNIAHPYGLEESGGIRALVMELVPGPTLADRIAQGPIPLEEALPVAKQIAEALEYAHERGIIHRDLKPANVKVTPDGIVKVLDFGLAKAMDDTPAAVDINTSPTISMAATSAGVILGTAAYMSPEQARGKSVDRRADIWAFGSVLYEMLTGKQVFSGEDTSHTMAAVIMKDPDWSPLPASTSAAIRKLLMRCLMKDPKQRLQAIGEARITLEAAWGGSDSSAETIPGKNDPDTPSPSVLMRFALAASVIVVAAIASLAGWRFRPIVEPPLLKFSMPLQNQDWQLSWPRISPDGKKIVYRADNQLWLRDLSDLQPRALPNTTGALVPFWSPDSSFVAYFKDQQLCKLSVAGGGETPVAEFEGRLTGGVGADWGPDDQILFTTGENNIYGVSAKGGKPEAILAPLKDVETDLHEPHILPGNRGILFVPHLTGQGPESLAVWSNGKRKHIFRGEGARIGWPVYAPSGHILFRREGDHPGLWAIPFSLSKLEITGEPFLVAADGGAPSVSANGTLVYVDRLSAIKYQLVSVDRTGKILQAIGAPQIVLFNPQLSPDGRMVAVSTRTTGTLNIWILDIARGTFTRLPSQGANLTVAWSPDGKWIAYAETTKRQILRRRVDSSGEEEVLDEGAEPSFFADGKSLTYVTGSRTKGFQIRRVFFEGDRKPLTLYYSSAELSRPVASPDGRYFAFTSKESGREEIYVKPVSGGEGKTQVSSNGGYAPVWSRRGDRIVYKEGDFLMEVAVHSVPPLSLNAPHKLFDSTASGLTARRDFGYDVAPDGEHFIFVQSVFAQTPGSKQPAAVNLNVVQNWFAEFKDRQK